jgi:heme/copper-type cytochrome/quinol oxidase subunit 1
MPKLSVWMVRASLVYMGIGFLFGALILANKGIPFSPWSWRLLNPHIELMIFGWTMQLVMGVAFWILPRFTGQQRYGKTILGWWSFALLNAGVVLMALGGWFALIAPLLAGRLLTLAAVIVFAVLMWPRVKPLAFSTVSQNSQTVPKEQNHDTT